MPTTSSSYMLSQAIWRYFRHTLARIRAIASRYIVLSALVIGGGVLYGIPLRRIDCSLLAFAATVPMILLALLPVPRGNLFCYLLSFYLTFLIAGTWLRTIGTTSWLLGPMFYVPFIAPSFYLLRIIRERWPAFPLVLLWPIVFVGIEWLRIRLSPGEVSCFVLGYGAIGSPSLTQIADLGGVFAVSFILCAIAGWIAEIILSLSGDLAARTTAKRKLLYHGLFAGVLYCGVIAYGQSRDTEENFIDGPVLQVIQSQLAWGHDGDNANNFEAIVNMTRSSFPGLGKVDAILWPENSVMGGAYTRNVGLSSGYGRALSILSAEFAVPILVDGPSSDPELGAEFHSQLFIKTDGSYEVYDKVTLVPWSEYVPFESSLRAVSDGLADAYLEFANWTVGWTANIRRGNVEAVRPFSLTTQAGEELRFATPICFEISMPWLLNEWHRHASFEGQSGLDFIVNTTNEILLGDSIHSQTMTMARFRAIEGRVSVVRVANDGISAMIDPNGRVREVLLGQVTGLAYNRAGVFFPRVILDSRQNTVYVHYGDWLPICCLTIAVALCLYTFAVRAAPSLQVWR